MAQIFPRWANLVSKLSILGSIAIVAAIVTFAYGLQRTDRFRGIGQPVAQPLPFSHEHHVKGLGLDCRTCHVSADESPFAGLPPTQTCMSCHARLKIPAEAALAPLREAARTGGPLAWRRVDEEPDFVYFDHGIHSAKGISCESCHGQVADMPLTRRGSPYPAQMTDCLGCHSHPDRFPAELGELGRFLARPPAPERGLDEALAAHVRLLKDCYSCHR